MRSPLIAYIRCATQNYNAYYTWKPLLAHERSNRSLFMQTLRRDWECIGALYRIERRRELLKQLLDHYKEL